MSIYLVHGSAETVREQGQLIAGARGCQHQAESHVLQLQQIQAATLAAELLGIGQEP